jgi:myo-inositol-1(or 4)-monophosphatase
MPDYLEAAKRAVRQAGTYLLEKIGTLSPDEVNEKTKNDFVTYVDKDSERMIVKFLKEKFPSHQFLAEEETHPQHRNGYCWIIDPLDGTKNYIQKIPIFSISVALQYRHQTILGLVFDPSHNELFYAESGEAAFLNGNKIRVSQQNFQYSLIATGFPHRKKLYLPAYLSAFEKIFLSCSGMRRCGSAALDLCYVACGRYEGFWELGLSIWDLAAGSFIIERAGGNVCDFWGEDHYLNNGCIIAGNQNVAKHLQKIIGQHFKRP